MAFHNFVYHRADFVYMGPPFIADYAVMQGGAAEQVLLQAAYDQCRLYRDVLYSPDIGLWQHIILGSWNDTTAWGTGVFIYILILWSEILNTTFRKCMGCGWYAQSFGNHQQIQCCNQDAIATN